MALYQIFNGPQPTTATLVAVTSGTAIKTMLQVKPSATVMARLVEWGFSCDAPASSSLLRVELIETDVAATVTAHVAAGIVKVDAAALSGGDPTTNLIQVGTTSTGYTSSGEGTITAGRLFDHRYLTTTTGYEYSKQLPLGREFYLQVGLFARIRVHASVAMNVVCWMTVEV